MAALLSLPAPQNKLCSERGKKNTFSFKPNVSVDVTKSSKVMSSSNEDCYFYYYSSCTKGSACSFRHEPAALQSDVVCAFWMKGSCTRPHCPFRHLDVSRASKPCFFEMQPGGCRKPHCTFIHSMPKRPEEDSTRVILEEKVLPVNNRIIVNKNKIPDLLGRATIVAKPSAKDRLGPQKTKGSVKDRLGGLDDKDRIEIFECSDKEDEEEIDSEEAALRAKAIGTLDLRKRLAIKRKSNGEDAKEEEEDAGETKKPKKSKKAKKEKKPKKAKKEKKSKKDADGWQKRIITRLSSPDVDEGTTKETEEEKSSLASQIASEREKSFALTKSEMSSRLGVKDKTEDLRSTKSRKKTKKRPGKETDAKEEQNLQEVADGAVGPKGNMNEVEKFLKDHPEVDEAANSSIDVMKELDELLQEQ